MKKICKLLISCDNILYCHNGRYYFKNQEWYDFYQRYLRVFDSIKIVNRVCNENTLPKGRVPIDDERIEVAYVPDFHGLKEYVKVFFKLSRVLHNITFGCDAAIIRLPSTIGQRVCKQVMWKKLPYAVEVVFDAEDCWKSISHRLSRCIWKKIDRDMRISCYRSDGVSCVTQYHLQTHYFSKKPYAFFSYYSSLALDMSFYTGERKFPDKQIVLANVANQVSYNGRKGFKEIIEAMAIIKDNGYKISASFVGQSYDDGERKLREYAKSLGVDDQILFHGYLSRDELDKLLNQVDIFVMPTKAEGLPRVIIEAMAKGLPVISSPVSGNPELLPPHFLVEYNDVDTLAQRIMELSTNSTVYESASKVNFNNSLKYEASILQKRRDQFYTKLRDLVK